MELINDDTLPIPAYLMQSTTYNSGARAGFTAARSGAKPVIPEPARVGSDRNVWRRGFRCGWKEGGSRNEFDTGFIDGQNARRSRTDRSPDVSSEYEAGWQVGWSC